MEVTPVPPVPIDLPTPRVGADSGTAARPAPSTASELGSALAGGAARLADQVNIHPLDVAGALQILIAEVRAALTLPGEMAAAPTQATTPLVLVQMVLQRAAQDDALEPAVRLADVTQAEADLRRGLNKAVEAVMAWRNVPALVVDVARDTREVVLAAVYDDPPNPLWLRPEWLGLAPRMERFWRRRRYARRGLSDPDDEKPDDVGSSR